MEHISTNVKPKCRSCGAPLLWALTKKGRRIPLDRNPVPDGNIEIEEADEGPPMSRVVSGQGELSPGLFPATRYKSHFSTCPNAKRHRRRK